MVARHRPAEDADPFEMRERYHAFTLSSEAPPPATGAAPYMTMDDTDEPLIATDADVGVIANHAVRLAMDALIGRAPSMFPYSMYLIGLTRAWIFEQAFQTIPIDTGPAIPAPATETSPETIADGVQFITEILESAADGNSGTS